MTSSHKGPQFVPAANHPAVPPEDQRGNQLPGHEQQASPFLGPIVHPSAPTPMPAEPVERVGRGLALALLAIPAGMIVSALLYSVGFIASLSSFAIALVAVALYPKAAGAAPRRGVPGLIAIIVVGVVLSFMAMVATDLVLAWTPDMGERVGFVLINLVNPDLLAVFLPDAGMFLLFAALGAGGTIWRLLKKPEPEVQQPV